MQCRRRRNRKRSGLIAALRRVCPCGVLIFPELPLIRRCPRACHRHGKLCRAARRNACTHRLRRNPRTDRERDDIRVCLLPISVRDYTAELVPVKSVSGRNGKRGGLIAALPGICPGRGRVHTGLPLVCERPRTGRRDRKGCCGTGRNGLAYRLSRDTRPIRCRSSKTGHHDQQQQHDPEQFQYTFHALFSSLSDTKDVKRDPATENFYKFSRIILFSIKEAGLPCQGYPAIKFTICICKTAMPATSPAPRTPSSSVPRSTLRYSCRNTCD